MQPSILPAAKEKSEAQAIDSPDFAPQHSHDTPKHDAPENEAATYLPDGLLGVAFAAAKDLVDHIQRTRVLVALAPQLPLKIWADILADTLHSLDKCHVEDRVHLVAMLRPFVSDGLVAKTLALAIAEGYEPRRARCLIELAPYLPNELVRVAAIAANTIENVITRLEVLIALGQPISEGQVSAALAAVKDIYRDEDRANALSLLGPYLSQSQLIDTLYSMTSLRDPFSRQGTVISLAPFLSSTQRLGAFAGFFEDPDNINLKIILPQLNRYILNLKVNEIITEFRTKEENEKKSVSLNNLYNYVNEYQQSFYAESTDRGTTPRGFSIKIVDALTSPDGPVSHEIFSSFASQLPKKDISEILDLIGTLFGHSLKMEALAALAPHMSEEQIEQILLVASSITLSDTRSEMLTILAPYLSERDFGAAVGAAIATSEERNRAQALSAIAPRLRRKALANVEQAIRTTQGDHHAMPPQEDSKVKRYRITLLDLANQYRYLSFKDCLAVSSKLPISALCATAGAWAGKYVNFIGTSFAGEAPFTPPLGLNQNSFTYIIFMFSIMFVFLIFGLFWVGFIAKPKNQGAALVVQHLVTFLSGALLGLKV